MLIMCLEPGCRACPRPAASTCLGGSHHVCDVPRGISFLLNRNRVNVAVSRAKYAAYIVRSPRLTDYLPSNPAGLVELGAFLALSEGDGNN